VRNFVIAELQLTSIEAGASEGATGAELDVTDGGR
jgi:hypothetical protein